MGAQGAAKRACTGVEYGRRPVSGGSGAVGWLEDLLLARLRGGAGRAGRAWLPRASAGHLSCRAPPSNAQNPRSLPSRDLASRGPAGAPKAHRAAGLHDTEHQCRGRGSNASARAARETGEACPLSAGATDPAKLIADLLLDAATPPGSLAARALARPSTHQSGTHAANRPQSGTMLLRK
jgi:hypothetical protein